MTASRSRIGRFFFFFQAEDGIRDHCVTGVQTCALPISADTHRLLELLRRLADAGNTVVVVEHDPAAMRAADWMVELGPGSGAAGGQLVYQGPAAGVRDAGTLTGQDRKSVV